MAHFDGSPDVETTIMSNAPLIESERKIRERSEIVNNPQKTKKKNGRQDAWFSGDLTHPAISGILLSIDSFWMNESLYFS
jgi:hypothetical protein